MKLLKLMQNIVKKCIFTCESKSNKVRGVKDRDPL